MRFPFTGGETAEMPSVYSLGQYDIAGYCVGVLEDGTQLPKFETYEEGDLLISLPSSGLHCAGYGPIYDVLMEQDITLNNSSEFGDTKRTLGKAT